MEQVIVCCGDNIQTCSGCMGGDTIVAYEYLQNRSKGLDSAAAYRTTLKLIHLIRPSARQMHQSQLQRSLAGPTPVRRCEGGECAESWRSGGDAEAQLAAVVANTGPVSICIDAALFSEEIYRRDPGSHRLQEHSGELKPLRAFGGFRYVGRSALLDCKEFMGCEVRRGRLLPPRLRQECMRDNRWRRQLCTLAKPDERIMN